MTKKMRAAALVSGFAVLALLLAIVGVSGLLAASVSARRPELGVRLALGATPGGIRRLVLRQAGVVIAVGLVIGLGAAVALSRLAADLLYETSPTDAGVYGVTALAVAVLALVASDGPARRATRIDPAETLRS